MESALQSPTASPQPPTPNLYFPTMILQIFPF